MVWKLILKGWEGKGEFIEINIVFCIKFGVGRVDVELLVIVGCLLFLVNISYGF